MGEFDDLIPQRKPRNPGKRERATEFDDLVPVAGAPADNPASLGDYQPLPDLMPEYDDNGKVLRATPFAPLQNTKPGLGDIIVNAFKRGSASTVATGLHSGSDFIDQSVQQSVRGIMEPLGLGQFFADPLGAAAVASDSLGVEREINAERLKVQQSIGGRPTLGDLSDKPAESLGQYARHLANMGAESLPAFIGAVALRNPQLAAGALGGTSGAQTYTDMRADGSGRLDAAQAGLLTAAIESGGEALSLPMVLGKAARGSLLKAAAVEGAQEAPVALGQQYVQDSVTGTETPIGQQLGDALDAALVGAGMGAAGHGVSVGTEKLATPRETPIEITGGTPATLGDIANDAAVVEAFRNRPPAAPAVDEIDALLARNLPPAAPASTTPSSEGAGVAATLGDAIEQANPLEAGRLAGAVLPGADVGADPAPAVPGNAAGAQAEGVKAENWTARGGRETRVNISDSNVEGSAGAISFEVRRDAEDRAPLQMWVTRDGKLTERGKAFTAEGEQTHLWNDGTPEQKSQVVDLLRERGNHPIGSQERKAIDGQIADVVAGKGLTRDKPLPNEREGDAPVGAWVAGPKIPGVAPADAVRQVMEVPIDQIDATEFDSAGNIAPEKRADASRYAEAMRNGDQFPNARGSVLPNGKIKLQDGHRRLAAAMENGATTLRVAVNPMPEPAAPATQAPTMQNRDRSRAASVSQMQDIRRNPDPERLGFSRDPNTGAPMVGAGKSIPDGDKGRADTVVMASGRRVPVRYAVVEADELAASHDADGRANPSYEAAPLKALNNGRTAGLQAAYASGNTDAYRQGIAADAGLHGVSAEAIASKRKPVLVRLYDPAQNTGDMGAESNASAQLGLSPTEQAQTDARSLPDLAGLSWSEDGNLSPTANVEFFRKWFRNIGDAQAATLQDAQGRPNAQALQRVKGALVQRAYGDERLLTALSEDVNPDNRNVMNALVQAAPAFATLDADSLAGEIRSAVVGGLELLRDASARGLSLRDAIAQGDLLGRNPNADTIAQFMAANARSANRMAEAFKAMAAYADASQRQAATLDVFGAAPTPSVQGALGAASIEDTNDAGTITGRIAEGAGSGQPTEVGRAGTSDAFALAAPAEPAAAQEVAPAPSAGLFGAPSTRDIVDNTQRNKDAARDGKTGTGRTDMLAGEGELFAGNRPAQDVLEDVAPDRRDPPAAPDDTALALLAREESSANGIEDADSKGLRDAVNKAMGGSPPITPTYLRGMEGLAGIAKPDYLTNLKRQQASRAPGMGTAGLYLQASDTQDGKPRFVIFTDTVLTPATAAFTAAHEVAGHHGLRSLFGTELDSALRLADQNPTVAKVADSMMQSRKMTDRSRAVEEALSDLAAASRTGDWQRIANKHRVTVGPAMRSRVRAALDNFMRRLKALFGKRGQTFTDAQVYSLLENAWKAAQSNESTAISAPQALESVEYDGKAFGRAVAAEKRARAGLSWRAKDAIDSWQMSQWETGELARAVAEDSAVAAEIRAAFEPVREVLRAEFGDTIPLHRGVQKGRSYPADRRLYSWTVNPGAALGFATNRRRQPPPPATPEQVEAAIAQYERVGYTSFRGLKYKRNKEYPSYYDIYEGNELLTDGDNIREEIEGRNEWFANDVKELAERGSVIEANIPVEQALWLFPLSQEVIVDIGAARDERADSLNPDSPSILESVEYTPEQEAALVKAGLQTDRRSSLARVADNLRERWAAVRDAVKDGDNFKQSTFDRFHGLRMAEAQVGLNDPEQSAYVAARMAAGLGSNMEGLMLYGAPQWDGGVLAIKDGTVGLLDALKPVEGKVDEWLGWMVGRRAKLLKSQGRENNLSDSDIAALLSLADGNEAAFQQAARDYLTIKNAVLDLAEQAGVIDPVARAAWDHAEYVPFYRADEGGSIGPGTRKGLAGQTSGIRTLKGGEQALADPLANIVRNFAKLVDASLKNRAVLLAVDGLGATYFTKAPREMQPATIPLDQVKKHLRDAGVPQATIDGMPPGALKGVQRMLSIVPPTGENVVRVMRDGKAEYYEVLDPLVLRSLTAFKQANKSLAIKPFIWFKRLLTTGVTTTAEFVGANFIRDSGSAWVISDDRFIPGWDSLKGIGNTLRNDAGTREMMMAGSTFLGGNFYDGDPDAAAASLRRALRAKGMSNQNIEGMVGTIARTPLHLWDAWLKLSGAVENANRRAVYDAALKAGRTKTEAAYMARDLMDFAMQGDAQWVQFFSDVLPFFNARLQGMYKLGRRAGTPKGRKAMILRGGIIALASAALYAWNVMNHADAWDELEEWDKDAYWHIAPGTDYHVRIPKPFELGLVFGTAPERSMEAVRRATTGEGDTPAATWDSLVRAITGTLAINPIPQAALPIAEQWANKRFFTGRPIENMGDENLLPEARGEWYTSDTMKGLGRMSGLSPKRLEHLWNGYTAGLGGYVLDASDYIVRQATDAPERPDMRLGEMPVLGRFLRAGPGRSKYSTQFYERLREAEQVEQTVKEYVVDGRDAEAKELEAENRELLGARIPSKRAKAGFLFANVKAMRQVQKELTTLREEMEGVALSRTLSGDEKRKRLDELETKRNRVVREAVKP